MRGWNLDLCLRVVGQGDQRQVKTNTCRAEAALRHRSTGGEAPPRSEEMSDQTFDRKIITPAEREARKVFAAAEAKKAISDYEKAQKAFHENRERLRTERLAREAEALKKKAVVQGEER